ncbi:MAG: GNAT family N-acetyltransferase [Bradyrhizobium sp.]|nr:GNAT family N-acetyltransferase [Bradyrhizobium sp.]
MTQNDDTRKPPYVAELASPNHARADSGVGQFHAKSDNTTAAASAGPYRIQTLRSREEIEPFREFWNACNPVRDCDLDFYLFVTEHIDGCLRPHVAVLLEGERPRALLAGRIDVAKIPIKAGYLALPVPELKILRIVHGGALGELSSETAQLLVSSVINSLSTREADAAMLESVEVNSPLTECARALPSRFCSDWLFQTIPHRMWNMSGAGGPFQTHLSSNARYQQRKRAAKLKSSFGEVRVERFRTPDELSQLMTSAETIAEKSYQRGLGVGFLRTPFVAARLAFEAQKGWLRGFVLYLDNQPCAFWIGSLRNGTFVSNYLAFNPTYSDYSPGMYLLLIAMEEIWADGSVVRLFDFGGGDAPYKERLANVCVEETQIYIFAPRLKPLAINALRSTIGAVSHSIKRSETLAPQLQKLKRWLRSRAAKRA